MGNRAIGGVGTLCVLFGVLFAPSLAYAQPFHLDDSLRGSTSGNASGGSFGAEGWTVTGVGDRIWYPLPRLASGYVEFTVTHITTASLPLPDHEIFAMYEDGYGIGEPITYGPFRGNHYKILMRIYGMVEPGRVGAMKLMWGMCPSGDPGHDACGCASFFEEPFSNVPEWNGDPVRMRVEWGGGHTRMLHDGNEVVAIDWSGSGLTFGPSDLHMMLGSPRNDGGLSAMPIGATFSDLVVDGEQGPMATCPGGTLDAGTPIDAGTCSAASAVTQDATAAVWEPATFPDASDLNVEGDGTTASAVVYLRFPAVSGSASHATLTMTASSSGSAAGGSGQVCRVDGASWDEATLTWTNRPTVSTSCSGGAHTIGASEVVTWDVTSLITPGVPIDLAIVSTDPDGAHYLSRESGGCASGPRLDVTLMPGIDGGPGVDAATPDASSATDGSTSMDARAGGDTGTRSGGGLSASCGCHAGTRSSSPFALVLALALAIARRARRQPRIIDSSSMRPSR